MQIYNSIEDGEMWDEYRYEETIEYEPDEDSDCALCKALIIITFAFMITSIIIFAPADTPGTITIKSAISCYSKENASLTDISDVEPVKEKSIFFHETSCNSYSKGKIVITSRQACAVESASRMNPNLHVYLLFTSPGIIKNENTTSDKYLQALSTYKNVRIHHLNYKRYISGTPLQDFYDKRKLETSRYPVSHASDILRYLTLWKYGGIYLDLDVIVLKSLEDLLPNYAGLESEDRFNSGIVRFDSGEDGHRFAELCVEDLKQNFNGNDWGCNGPGVITRLMKKLCGVDTVQEMLRSNCSGFKIYPPEVFYPIPWWDWMIYFDRKYNKKIFNITRHSYVAHVWNNFSKRKKIMSQSNVPYSLLARKYCPKVFTEFKNLLRRKEAD